MGIYEKFELTIEPESVYIFSKSLQYSAEIKPLKIKPLDAIILYEDEMNHTTMTKYYILEYYINVNDINQDKILTKLHQMDTSDISYDLIIVDDYLSLRFSPRRHSVIHHTFFDDDTEEIKINAKVRLFTTVDPCFTDEEVINHFILNENDAIDFYKDFWDCQ